MAGSISASTSGIDVDAIVSQLIQAERAPERLWQAQQRLLQQQAAALTDLKTKLGTLDSSVDALKDSFGVFSQNTVSSSDSTIVTASTDSGATQGVHTVVVSSLASGASFYSGTFESASAILPSGTFRLTVGGSQAITVTINESNNTLDKLAAQLNQSGLSLNAGVVTDANGARLVISSKATGASNEIQIDNVSGFTFTRSSSARNASITVDGVPVESQTNQVAGALAGVTLQLQSSAPGKTITVLVSPDTGRVSQAVQNFINNFNAIVKAVNAQFTYDSASGSAGVLSGDSTVRTLQQELLSRVSYVNSDEDGIPTLSALGIKMENDGTLTLDSSKLNSLLQTDFKAVKQFFQGNTADGFGHSFASALDSLNDSVSGPLVLNLKGNTDSQNAIARQIDAFEVRIAARQQLLLEEYSRIDAILRQFPLTQNQITAQLNALNK